MKKDAAGPAGHERNNTLHNLMTAAEQSAVFFVGWLVADGRRQVAAVTGRPGPVILWSGMSGEGAPWPIDRFRICFSR